MELDWDVFDREWQRVAVDEAKPVYKQGEDLLSYAESLQYPLANNLRDTMIAQATQVQRRKPQGEKHERVFDDIVDATGFAILVDGVAYFWNDSPGYKVVWYTYNKKEIW